MLAYTGLETVANLAEEARRPGVDLPRSLFAAIVSVGWIGAALLRPGRFDRQVTVGAPDLKGREQILKIGLLREGENIFAVNLAQVHDRLQRLPQVDEVQVEATFPDGTKLVTLHQPIR